MASIDSLFELAIELRDKEELKDSVGILSKILDDYPTDEGIDKVYSVLGGIYGDLGEYSRALNSFKTATELNPKSELASLGLYVIYVKLKRDEEAIRELIRYLKSYPADLYKETLEELLEGLEKGYMTDYKDDIRNFARINGICD